MKITYKNLLILFLPLFFVSCSASKITLKEDKIKNISAVAVLPFDLEKDIPASIASESEENFKRCLIESGLVVVEREKVSDILKENELSMLLPKYSDDIVSLLGVDAFLTGKITQYSESVQDVEYMGYDKDENGVYITSRIDETTKTIVSVEKKKIKDKSHELNFKIFVRLISVRTGETIMVMENTLSSETFNEGDRSAFNQSLNGFKDSVLKHMNSDLKKELSKAKNKKS